MDTFTDVDIFADLLDAAARHVPVYILLDEQEAYHFVSMVINCKVNLDQIPVSIHSFSFFLDWANNIYCVIMMRQGIIFTKELCVIFAFCFTDDACQDCGRNNLLFQDREIIQGAGEGSFLTG